MKVGAHRTVESTREASYAIALPLSYARNVERERDGWRIPPRLQYLHGVVTMAGCSVATKLTGACSWKEPITSLPAGGKQTARRLDRKIAGADLNVPLTTRA